MFKSKNQPTEVEDAHLKKMLKRPAAPNNLLLELLALILINQLCDHKSFVLHRNRIIQMCVSRTREGRIKKGSYNVTLTSNCCLRLRFLHFISYIYYIRRVLLNGKRTDRYFTRINRNLSVGRTHNHVSLYTTLHKHTYTETTWQLLVELPANRSSMHWIKCSAADFVCMFSIVQTKKNPQKRLIFCSELCERKTQK